MDVWPARAATSFGDAPAAIHIATAVWRYPDGGLSVRVWPPDDVADTPDVKIWLAAKSAVAAAKEADRELSQTSLLELMAIKCRRATKIAGIEKAVHEHALRVHEGDRNARMYSYVRDLQETP